MNINGFDWSDRKVLVTGASGFKGSWLCAALSRLGARVYGTIRNQRDPLSAWDILRLHRNVVNVTGDVSDRQDVYDMINTVEPDVIFHLAAKALVPVSLRDPRRTFDVNIMGTLNIIEACRKLQVCNRILICSTDHVFGNIDPRELPEGGFPEKSRVSYGGPYDTSKAAMELMVRSYHYTYWHQLPEIGITRCANVFGFGDVNQRRIIPLFVRTAVSTSRNIPLRYRHSGRQFIHVTDAIAGYIRAASALDNRGRNQSAESRPEERSPFTPTFHFAIEDYQSPNEPFIRMEALARKVAGIFNAVVDDSTCVDYPKNENQIQALNCVRTRELLNWNVKRSLDQGIKALGAWYQASGDNDSLHEMITTDLETIVANLKSANAT